MEIEKEYTLETMTKNARSLLLYFETRLVDNDGKVAGCRMNDDDHDIAKRMVFNKLIEFGRLPFKLIKSSIFGDTHMVRFSEKAWELAHAERKTRSKRTLKIWEERYL